MGIVLTGTVCPFPFTFPADINPQNATIKNCTETYAQYLAPQGFYAFQYTIMAFSLLFLLIFVVRLILLGNYAKTVLHKSILDTTQFRFFSIGLVGSLLLFIESIDMFGFNYILPKEIYYVCDELIAVTLFTLVVQLVDFWAILALSMRINATTGLPVWEKRVFFVITFINFVGCITIGMVMYKVYFLLEGIKTMIGGILLILFLGRSVIFVMRIQHTLLDSIGATGPGKRSEASRVAVRTLRRKFFLFAIIVLIAAAVLIEDAIESWGFTLPPGTPVNLQWEYPIQDQIDVSQIFLKVVYLLSFFALIYFFNVPNELAVLTKGRSQLSSNEHGENTEGHTGPKGNGSMVSVIRQGSELGSSPKFQQQYSFTTISDAPRPVMSSSIGVDGEGVGLRLLLEDEGRREKFSRFVSKRFASESVKFYEVASRFEQIKDDAERKALGKEILNRHFTDDAPLPITIKDSRRKQLLKETEFGPDTFKAAVKETYEVLHNNFYNPYIEEEKEI